MKYRLGGLKRLMGAILAAVLTVSAPTIWAFGATTYYDQKTEQTVTRGVEYEKSSRMTDAGIQNLYVLKVDLTESTLEFKEVESTVEYGLKETVKKLLSDNGALAGVNSDFFGMTGTYSAPFGAVMNDGEIVSAGTSLNHDGDQYVSFFMDEDDNPFFDYFKMTATFTNGEKAMELASINKVTSMVFPIYFDRQASESTADLDKRFGGLVKFVVEDDEITYISQPGETVAVPEDGYLIVMSKDYRTNAASTFQVDDEITLNINSSIDLDDKEFGFGGGGKLLINGTEAPATSIVASGRQPRTAFGLSEDGETAIFMVVDGRGDSVGVTHSEMAAYMKAYGAYNAMHLDGGGSSTMAVKTVEDTQVTVKNIVSDGSERKVINAVGIFQNAEKGDIEEIVVSPSMMRTVPNKTMTFTVYGLDEYYNRIEIPVDEVEMQAIGVDGMWNGYDFTPSESGNFAVTAIYKELAAYSAGVVSAQTGRLKPSADIKLNGAGGTATVAMQVIDTDGFSHWVSKTTQYEVADPSIGTMKENVFTALKTGSTYIKCTRDGQTAYIAVTVGDSKAVTTPKATSAADPLQKTVSKTNDGAYYLNIIGTVTYTGDGKIDDNTYADARTKARDTVDSNAEVAIYGGKSDIKTSPKLDTLSWTGGYRFLTRGGTSVAMVSAASGGIRATNASQYANLARDLDASDNSTIVIIMDKTPGDFTSAAETAYFRGILNKYISQGKAVFVVSCSGVGQWSSVKDGIRYINLPSLWKNDGSVNGNFSMLKLRVNGQEVSYEVAKV
ncbi:phosphodiester glycosidase family protein [Anaerotignum sp.]|uniref:phosphodiester glycosidase family protein n=1 Tax=Anaerotignum sp. TaxID=2039241 RepID=UPI0027150F5A|nr:phosphodiester glycosidase family protein [Anaerotignum sp.]